MSIRLPVPPQGNDLAILAGHASLGAGVLLLLGALGWYQQRMVLCDDALQRRRSVEPGDSLYRRASRGVGAYCFTWVGR